MSYSTLSCKELVRKSKQEDSEAFEEIIKRDSRYVLSWISDWTKNRTLSEDILQVTFIKCWKNIKKFKGDSSFKTWACAIARNLVLDHYRKPYLKRECSLESNEEGRSALNKIFINIDPLKSYKSHELKIFLGEIMNKMSDHHKNTLYYFAVEGLSYQEISKIEKCSIGTVMSRLFYARKSARDLINKHKDRKLYEVV